MNGAVIPKARVPIYAPNGTPISTAFKYWDTDASYGLALQTALQAVDKVHGDGLWQDVRVYFDEKSELDEVAGFAATKNLGYLSFNPIHQITAFQVVHELGHGLEKYGFEDIEGYASATSSELARWRQAIQHSQKYQRLQDMRVKKTQVIQGLTKMREVEIKRSQVEYLLYWHELWARSYAQYVCLTVGDLDMLREMASDSDSLLRQVSYPWQWAIGDFDEIGQAIEDVFRSRGWLK